MFYALRRFRLLDWLATLALFAGIVAAVVLLDRSGESVAVTGAVAVDGDSLLWEDRRIRLTGIDAPELTQTCMRSGKSWACGQAAQGALAKLVRDRSLDCKSEGADFYGRSLMRCLAGDRDLGEAMVLRGMAVDTGPYFSAEGKARRRKVGLWAGTFQPPRQFREEMASRTDPSLIEWLRALWSGDDNG